jgi:hypothetical protein
LVETSARVSDFSWLSTAFCHDLPDFLTILLFACFRSFHEEIARGLDVNGRGINSVLRRTTFKGMDALHAAAGGKGKLPICRYLVEEAKMDVNKRDTFKGTN